MSSNPVGVDADAKTKAIKDRIISHMNADHADSLSLYLQHFCGVPAATASKAKLSDIELDRMIIESSVGRNLVSINPPLKNFSEAREKVIAMHHEALKGLGLSEIKIDEFALPHSVMQWATFFVCVLCYTTYPFPEKIAPQSGSWMYYAWSLGGVVPSLAELASKLAPTILPIMLAIHAFETGLMWWIRLRKHRVSPGSSVWWLWLGNAFISGVATFRRFDELVQEKDKALKQGKH